MTSLEQVAIDPRLWFTDYCTTQRTSDNLECNPGFFNGYEGEDMVYMYVVEIWRDSSGRANSGTPTSKKKELFVPFKH